MERVSGGPCAQWAGALAVRAAGRLPDEEEAQVRSHLAHCAHCRRQAQRLAPVAAVLGDRGSRRLAQGPRIQQVHAPVPQGLAAEVEERLAAEQRREARRRQWGRGLVGAAVAVVVGLGLFVYDQVSTTPGRTAGASRTVALRGAPGVAAMVHLSAAPWGTAIGLNEHGQPKGQLFEVVMRTSGGFWWTAGSYRSAAGATTVRLACGVPLDRVAAMEVRDARGRVVLWKAGR